MANVYVVFALVLLAACATADDPKTVSAISEVEAAGGPVLPDAVAAAPGTGVDYTIGPLDVLDISVFQVPDLSKTVQVTASGQISLPLVGAINASGKTASELQTDIAAKLGAEYLQSPEVSVSIKEYTSQRITVDGSVNKPGIYPTTGETTLLQAIALAEGLDRVADARGIVVFRTVQGKRQAAKFDLAAIRAGAADDPPVYGGDVIVVDESGGKTALRGIRESIGIFGLFTPLLL